MTYPDLGSNFLYQQTRKMTFRYWDRVVSDHVQAESEKLKKQVLK